MNYQSKYKILRYSTNYLAVCKERYIKTIYKINKSMRSTLAGLRILKTMYVVIKI